MYKVRIGITVMLFTFIAVSPLYNTNAEVYKETVQGQVCNAETVVERVDDILNGFLYKYEGYGGYDYETVKKAAESGTIYNFTVASSSYINRANALSSIMKVIGLNDDLVCSAQLIESNELDVHQSYSNGSTVVAQYIWSALEKFESSYEYEVSDSKGFKGSLTSLDGVRFYPQRSCTIEEVLRFIARAINSDNSENYIDIARENGICSEEMLDRIKDHITVSELKDILVNLYSVKGDVYYSNSYKNVPASPLLDSDHESTYFEKYIKTQTFVPSETEINGTSVTIMENKWGTKAISLRDLMTAYNANIEWDNGEIIVEKENRERYVFFLDGYPGQIRLCNDGQLCTQETVYSEYMTGNMPIEEITFFGQYEMINDSIYVYPSAYFSVLGFMELKSEIKPSELQYQFWGSTDSDPEPLYSKWNRPGWELYHNSDRLM